MQNIHKPQGMILITGPTGSGKTVTLYSALNERNTDAQNISTVEDPVEISLPGINQIQTNEKISLSFSHVLRALLRQDPDIIMIGEIRDKETATIALRAAQTGHLVLSTLHTNSAGETLTRLMQMGFEPYQLMSTIRLIVAQRLVRKLCPHCRQSTTTHDVIAKQWQLEAPIFQSNPQGCHACIGGYQGRTGLYEMLAVVQENLSMHPATSTDTNSSTLTAPASHTLWHDGIRKVKQGLTTIEELYRVLEPPVITEDTGETR